MTITLHVIGLGNVPSFKNNKMIARGRLITNPKRQKWMEACIQGFVSELNSAFPTIVEEIATDACPRLRTASFLPLDDSWQWVPEISVTAGFYGKGQEGATITIERL